MKLRNKITGEIRKGEAREDGIHLYDETTEQWYKYELDLLARNWEYYKESPVYYAINEFGTIESYPVGCISDEDRKLIGNYFETEKEAKEALEKLKAWKRLKDSGFKFLGETCEYKADKHFGSVFYETSGDVSAVYEDISGFFDDLDLIFERGEE